MTKARTPAPTAMMLAPNCTAPPVAAAAFPLVLVLSVAAVAADVLAFAAATSPLAASKAPQRCLAMLWMVWRSVAEQSLFCSRQVVPAARKALEPVVQRQTGSVGAQPEEPTALVTQAICEEEVLVEVWGEGSKEVETYTALGHSGSEVDGGVCGGSGGSGG